MRKILRPYQAKAIEEAWGALKKDDNPVLLMASVGAGKSLMIAHILLKMQQLGKRALCIVNNAELVRNNCQTFVEERGKASIYCAALGEKDTSNTVIFGTPQSILNGINRNKGIANIQFNLIVVDEAHNIAYNNPRSTFMRILRHYKQAYNPLRVLGATGTNYRFKGYPIVGEDALFKTQVGNITTSWLIENKYLTEPTFHVEPHLVIDFSKVKVKNNGLFDMKDLEETVNKNMRLTALIMKQVQHIIEAQNRFGVIIFASTRKHAEECLSHLPPDKSAIILGDTPHNERAKILDKARRSEIKYLVNISIISVGVDIPGFDTIAYLRPTESLVLMTQTMGRGLRLYPNKKDCLVLDFAQNIERHKDWDDPILLKALTETNKDKELIFPCPKCEELNGEFSRRCVGMPNKKRCDFYFEFKTCPQCKTQNDLVARYCRSCKQELINPNDKLSLSGITKEVYRVKVKEGRYSITGTPKHFRINAQYICENGLMAYEFFNPCANEKAKNIFYAKFLRPHHEKPSQFYMDLTNMERMKSALADVRTPEKIDISPSMKGFQIHKKHFL